MILRLMADYVAACIILSAIAIALVRLGEWLLDRRVGL